MYTQLLVALVVLVVLAIFVGYKLESSFGTHNSDTTQNKQESVHVLLGDPGAPKSVTSSDMEKTTLPCCSVQWTIPKKKNPEGGWDSITGFWEAETPDRWTETWNEVF